ncbi:DUF4156 domain-containing protein [Pleionea sp. CnH1-48]|uniref:DUF4156 domain-containing protein n=1 Tax=Pleionea sp. CnH1-48 TaxID=2954494 RepID=UPI0020975C0E|nr:DUF4156 domain-containing protein [Pleionea sp. CnH1-48]MCO7223487.1 DUF4156 domain-containing protein [Pleionea sp. CnH1-48]
MKKLLTVVVALNLAACSAIQVNPGAERVRLTHQEPGNECRFLGDVTGNQGDFFTGGFTSNADLETGARNDLKNKAAALGGNLVYLLTQRAGQTGSFDVDYGGSTQQTNVTLTGNVYSCP